MYTPAIQKEQLEQSRKYLSGTIKTSDVDALRNNLIFHEWRYYVQNDPLLSDYEYDQLYKKLEKIEIEHPELITPDSPTQRVASDLNGDTLKVKHIVPMLSLGNSYNAEDLIDFDRQVKKICDLPPESDVEYSIEPKFDGGSIAIIYENDLLVRAATRGNGTKGEEITANSKAIPSIPLKALFSSKGIQKAELRGEALIRKENFKKINASRAEEDLPLFANPRNAATGGLRMKDPNETRSRGLEAFIFQVGYAIDGEGNDVLTKLKKHSEAIHMLGELGFKIPKKGELVANNIAKAVKICQQWEIEREAYPYEIDGMVVKVNDYQLQEKSGSTQHHPRWAIAYKFKAKQATSKLLTVEYQVGKTGSITPVAKIEPVQLAGVTVSSISLHNEEFIKSKDIRLGDTVVVERAGDVIPYIVKSLANVRDGSEKIIDFPTHCPSCHTSLIKEENEAAWRCPNDFCPAQQLQKMIFHVSKDAMDIDGFGKSYIERFQELGWIKDISDIYNLDYKKIAELEGFGSRSAENLEKAIDKAKNNPIHRLLHSLSIHHLGKKASKLIAQNIDHVLDLKDWGLEKYIEIKDIGPVVAANTYEFFHDKKSLEIMNRLEHYGVNLTQTEEDKPLVVEVDAPLVGKTILFTGSLQEMTRNEAKKLAESNGAKNISSVSGNLDILVVGEKAGSKLKKAEELGTVQIMTEREFLDLVKIFMRWHGYMMILFISCQSSNDKPNNETNVPKKEITNVDTIKVDTIINLSKNLDYDTLQWQEITKKNHGIYIDLRYATNDNFTKTQIYDCNRCFLRPALAKKLIRLQDSIYLQRKWSIKVYDCYRPRSAQQRLWDQVPNATYVTPPEKGSMHNRGLAVDLTLVDENGEEINMGSEFDSFSTKSHTDNYDLPKEALNNRKILYQLMDIEGLKGIRTEWWHYSIRTSSGKISDWEWACK